MFKVSETLTYPAVKETTWEREADQTEVNFWAARPNFSQPFSRLSVVLLSYDSRSTPIRLDRRKKLFEMLVEQTVSEWNACQ